LAREVLRIAVTTAEPTLFQVGLERSQRVQLLGVDIVRQFTHREIDVDWLSQFQRSINLFNGAGDVNPRWCTNAVPEKGHYNVRPVNSLTVNDGLGSISQLRRGMKFVQPRA
jgi:hypothetical protein